MAIQNRRGLSTDFDPNKLLPGEFAFPLDTKEVHYCVSPGDVRTIATKEELQKILTESPEAYAALEQLMSDLEENPSELTNILSNISSLSSNKVDKSMIVQDDTSVNPNTVASGPALKKLKDEVKSQLQQKVNKTDIVNTDTVNDTTKVPSSAVTHALGVEIDTLNNNLAKYINVNCAVGVDTFITSLSSLGIGGRTILSCQCSNSVSSICKIIGFSVVGDTIYISIDGGVLVNTAQIRISYI